MKLFLCLILILLSTTVSAGIVIDDFERYPADKFPASWRAWPFQRGKAADIYSVRSEALNKFLAADDSANMSIQILRDFYWKIEDHPRLSWRWRANILPQGADETSPSANDSACGVYVIISKARKEAIKYTWSTSVPVGIAHEKKPGKLYMVVAESGSGNLGKWRSQNVNVSEDYKKYFGRPLDRDPIAIAVLTDGNATHTRAACDYDDFVIK